MSTAKPSKFIVQPARRTSHSRRMIALALCKGALALGLSACSVYDASLLPDEPPSDANASDTVSPADRSADNQVPSCDSGADRACSDDVRVGDARIDAPDGGSGDAARDADATTLDVVADQKDAAEAGSQDGAGSDGAETGGDARPAFDASDAAVIIDNCPNDPAKTDPGRCGCGVVETDSDGDGTPNCVDSCPTDPLKTQAGTCGCGHADPPTGAGAAFCFKESMVHRYSFKGTGTVATDSIGATNGTIQGGSRDANQSGGSVTLSGDDGTGYRGEGYVDLHANVLAGLTSATFEAWVTWAGAANVGGAAWHRIFDIGDQTGNGISAVGHTYVFLSPSGGQTGGAMRATFSSNGTANEAVINASIGALPIGVRKHVALVIDDAINTMSLYVDGSVAGFVLLLGNAASITDSNCWLGRSQFAVDPELNGALHEFRIYNIALSASQVNASFVAGPDPTYLP